MSIEVTYARAKESRHCCLQRILRPLPQGHRRCRRDRHEGADPPTILVKIVLVNGSPIEIEKSAAEARSLAEKVSSEGTLDPLTGQFHLSESILRVEVAPPEQFGEGWFSEN